MIRREIRAEIDELLADLNLASYEREAAARAIERLVERRERAAVRSTLDEALNSGDGSYRP